MRNNSAIGHRSSARSVEDSACSIVASALAISPGTTQSFREFTLEQEEAKAGFGFAQRLGTGAQQLQAPGQITLSDKEHAPNADAPGVPKCRRVPLRIIEQHVHILFRRFLGADLHRGQARRVHQRVA
jgi:hypothetical protein